MLPHYIAYNLLFADLMHRFVYIDGFIYFFISFLIIVFFWMISRIIFSEYWQYVPIILVLLTPWFWYLFLAHSIYIYFLFLILIISYGILLIRNGRDLPGNVFLIIGSVAGLFSSVIFLILIPFLYAALLVTKTLDIKKLKYPIIFFALFLIPLTLLIISNKSNFKNNLLNDVKVFSDPGLINTVNRYQGAATLNDYKYLGKVSENKYIFYGEYFLIKYINALTPATIFTPKYKLLGFSFTPPLFLAFAIPFLAGFILLLKNKNIFKYILIDSSFIIPTLLAGEEAALNRLILILPAVIYLITLGLIEMLNNKKLKAFKIFWGIFIFLLVFQSVVVIGDIATKEGKRFTLYYGNNYELVEP